MRKTSNQAIPLLKIHLPYDEADHVFNIALNLLAGGSCLDHLETRRTDEAYLNALGAQRIADPYFFYVSNAAASTKSARQIVFAANDRCDQENTIRQLKACGALAAPLDNLVSNWAYMVIASPSWSLKIWSGLVIRPRGSSQKKQQQAETKRRVIRMDFHTFCQRLIQIPAQIIRRSRQLVYRLLSYRESMEPLLLIHDNLSRPMRC